MDSVNGHWRQMTDSFGVEYGCCWIRILIYQISILDMHLNAVDYQGSDRQGFGYQGIGHQGFGHQIDGHQGIELTLQ